MKYEAKVICSKCSQPDNWLYAAYTAGLGTLRCNCGAELEIGPLSVRLAAVGECRASTFDLDYIKRRYPADRYLLEPPSGWRDDVDEMVKEIERLTEEER